ncbi:hypothetical protein C6502_02930 [Candidatus Poribacteria bacterium]|nr:MAG: hypothetical protein C6502_02930 [Candidatus Poribacteria bacterium]
MKQMLMWMAASLTVFLVGLGCSSTHQLATETIYDAKVQIEAAKTSDAQNLAPQELADAEQMLGRSEEMLNEGKETEAYRLGMRAQLKARIAAALAVANQLEAKASSTEEELELKLKAAAAAHRDLEQAEQELEELQSTPEE